MSEWPPIPGTSWSRAAQRVDQGAIDAYAEVSGDRNPLHVDEDFARKTPYGGTIAHGLLTLALVSDLMGRHAGRRWLEGGELDVAFLAPVRPGDEVAVSAVARDRQDDSVPFAIEVHAGDWLVLAGTARVPAS